MLTYRRTVLTDVIERTIRENPGALRYDYRVQAWVENGKVARCGHPDAVSGCYACQHAGEAVRP